MSGELIISSTSAETGVIVLLKSLGLILIFFFFYSNNNQDINLCKILSGVSSKGK